MPNAGWDGERAEQEDLSRFAAPGVVVNNLKRANCPCFPLSPEDARSACCSRSKAPQNGCLHNPTTCLKTANTASLETLSECCLPNVNTTQHHATPNTIRPPLSTPRNTMQHPTPSDPQCQHHATPCNTQHHPTPNVNTTQHHATPNTIRPQMSTPRNTMQHPTPSDPQHHATPCNTQHHRVTILSPTSRMLAVL
jgi:hypothetical protein